MSLLQTISSAPVIQPLVDDDILSAGIEAAVLRLDMLDPIISGNKLYKLNHYLEQAIGENKSHIITQGGPYSNHLHATAFAAKKLGLSSTGILQGTQPEKLTGTLEDCNHWGMELLFTGQYGKNHAVFTSQWLLQQKNAIHIPQGGAGQTGVLGAEAILDNPETHSFDIIMAVCGTGTMGAGLANSKSPHQRLILVSALKNNFSIEQDICKMINASSLEEAGTIMNFEYHEGGYAKTTQQLFKTMNMFYLRHQIPTDHVYTGKLVLAFYDMLKSGDFKKGKRVLIVHSGGLQGNRSLKNGELIFQTSDYL